MNDRYLTVCLRTVIFISFHYETYIWTAGVNLVKKQERIIFSVKQTKRVINITSIYRIKLVIIQPDLLMMSHKGFHGPEQGIPWQPHVFDHKTIL